MRFTCVQGIRPNCNSQYGSHSKFIIRKIVFSDVVFHGRYGEKPCVMTQVNTVKDTIVTSYTNELKITGSAILLTTAACKISV